MPYPSVDVFHGAYRLHGQSGHRYTPATRSGGCTLERNNVLWQLRFSIRHLKQGISASTSPGRFEKVVYTAVNRSERWSDPEEKVRAEFYAELIYRYGYSPDRIGVEITVPDRSPKIYYADLVVFRDDDRKRPFAVIECKKEAISDAEFAQL